MSHLSLERVEHDDVEFADDFALVGGRPFTGIIFSHHPCGQVEMERFYLEGLPEGLQQWWHSNGQLECRAIAIRGNGSSESWEWYADGSPMSYRRNGQNGLWVELKKWDEQGSLIEDQTRIEPVLTTPDDSLEG